MARFRPTLRMVIGLMCAFVVLIVAVITLAITYTVSLDTVRDIGRKHSLALATTAKGSVETYFGTTTQHLDALAELFLQKGADMPSYFPDQTDMHFHDIIFTSMFTASRAVDFHYMTMGCIFEDGAGSSFAINGNYIYFASRFVDKWPRGNMSAMHRALYLSNRTEVADPTVVRPLLVNFDARFAAYTTARMLVQGSKQGIWYPVTLYVVGSTVDFIIPGAVPLLNRSGAFIGLGTAVQPITRVNSFLEAVKGTKNTEAFVIERDLTMAGSTYPAPFSRIDRSASASPVVGTGCATNADTAIPGEIIYVGCRLRATAYTSYPPLQAAVADKAWVTSAGIKVKVLEVGGENYFTVAAAVDNRYRLWGMFVVLCMPESDVLGDIVSGRNMAIGVTAGVCVAAALLAFGLIYAMLQPLANVSKQMLATARLRETIDQKNYSNLAEIYDLQKAYTNMNTAIKSFTRYVPRDVVKDLMASGQLCTIQMTPQRCTMLFVDIAGFTTVCERVPPDVLSALVSQYFDRASRIVMAHDGLIDKFIGDCIMAVWGAPFGVANQEVKAALTGKLLDRETMVEPLSKNWDEAGELLRVRVGISSGEVLAGNMGSADRMSYTVIGDPVNLAARLESMNKQLGTRVMVSEMTAVALSGLFVLRLLMPIAVVGKDKPVKVYEVMGVEKQFDTAAVDRVQSADDSGVECSESLSDKVSQISRASATRMSASGMEIRMDGRTMRKSKATTMSMLRDSVVQTVFDHPVTASDDEVALANQFTTAVHAYLRRDFAGALAALSTLVKIVPESLLHDDARGDRSSFAGKSVSLLRDLCEGYLRDGCPEDFDGVFRALEK
jgi:class 3 adenylate cyclase